VASELRATEFCCTCVEVSETLSEAPIQPEVHWNQARKLKGGEEIAAWDAEHAPVWVSGGLHQL
jgi:hypothetical protein